MSILSGIKKVIPYFKNADGNYEQLSYKTSSQTVDFDDGKTAETKLGAIKGITTSTSVTETGYAADAKTVSEINQSLVLTHKDKLCSLTIGQNYDISKLEDKYKYIIITGAESKLIPLWQIKLYDRITLSLVRQVSDSYCIYQLIRINSNIITYDDRYIKGFEDTGLTVYGIY